MKDKVPSTNAIRYLNEKNVKYIPMFYKYVEHGGTKVSAKELGVDEHKVIKTLIMENDKKEYFIILMHGDKEVSLKNMASQEFQAEFLGLFLQAYLFCHHLYIFYLNQE